MAAAHEARETQFRPADELIYSAAYLPSELCAARHGPARIREGVKWVRDAGQETALLQQGSRTNSGHD